MKLYSVIKWITAHPLNRKDKMAAVIRFVRWQIGIRLIPGEFVFNWINDAKFFVRKGENGLTGNIYCGLHDFADMAYIMHVMRDDDLFIDVGANSGSYSILACAVAGAKGYAFEPVPKTFKRLSKNISLNNLENRVACFNIGIGKQEGTLIFTNNEDAKNHVSYSKTASAYDIEVDVKCLDSMLVNADPTLIKIDVEGFEIPVLQGASKTLTKESLYSIVIEMNGSGSVYDFDEAEILQIMNEHNFYPYEYDPFTRKLKPLKSKSLSSGNTIFIRNIEFAKTRVDKCPEITVNGQLL